MATLDSIADEIGYTRNELMQSMVKFGLTNRDWRNEGLTAHKRLPRYQENPDMATKPPSAAQLAARKRFAEMARNGSLNRKRQIAAKKKAAGAPKANPVKKTVSSKPTRLAGVVKRNPSRAKPKSSTVYRVEYSKDGKKWDTWMTVMYLDMAKAIANRLADDPFHKNHYVRIESANEIL